MKNIEKKLKKAHQFINIKTKNFKPQIAIVLGSGLNNLKFKIDKKILIPYKEIPYMPIPTVEGHKGNFIFGYLEKIPTLIMQGRVHFYEGYSMQEITFPIMLMRKIGIKYLILTAAVGGIKANLQIGDIVIVKDYINFMFDNPLIGKNNTHQRFIDMSSAYDKNLIKITKQIAKQLKIKLYEGIYIAVKGPSFETPAEIKMFKKLGGDIIGMSIVPETIIANQQNIKVLALCYVSNLAAGISKKLISHEEVLKNYKNTKIEKLIVEIMRNL